MPYRGYPPQRCAQEVRARRTCPVTLQQSHTRSTCRVGNAWRESCGGPMYFVFFFCLYKVVHMITENNITTLYALQHAVAATIIDTALESLHVN